MGDRLPAHTYELAIVWSSLHLTYLGQDFDGSLLTEVIELALHQLTLAALLRIWY